MIFKSNDHIVFAGDSVTDMGSALPVGEGLFDALGNGYVREIENLLCSCYPEVPLRIVNAGVGGNTSRDLLGRWERDVLSRHPDWVSICIGINDVWRQFDLPGNPEASVSLSEYEENVEKMVLSVKDSVKGVFLLTPYYMEPLAEDAMRSRMDEYVSACCRIAEQNGCILVDFQKMFNDYFRFRHSTFIAWDRVHPNRIGSALMAREFLLHCGFDFQHRP